jgi:hypothetical protein
VPICSACFARIVSNRVKVSCVILATTSFWFLVELTGIWTFLVASVYDTPGKLPL